MFIFQPFNATRINASAINERVSVLEKDNGSQGSGKAGFWEEFEASEAMTASYFLYDQHHLCYLNYTDSGNNEVNNMHRSHHCLCKFLSCYVPHLKGLHPWGQNFDIVRLY